MTQPCPDPVRLSRRDPERNMARFYTISFQPTLFGEVTMVRNWGRIGTAGQILMETYQTVAQGTAAAETLEKVKRRRGYLSLAER